MIIELILTPDEKFFKYRNVYDACVEARCLLPDEVGEYFSYSDPPPLHTEIYNDEKELIFDADLLDVGNINSKESFIEFKLNGTNISDFERKFGRLLIKIPNRPRSI